MKLGPDQFMSGENVVERTLGEQLDALILNQRALDAEIEQGWNDIKKHFGVTPEEHLARLEILQQKMFRYIDGQKEKERLIGLVKNSAPK